MDENDIRRGEEILRQMLGEQAAGMQKAWRDLEPELERYITGFVAGNIWARPGLPLKMRSLVTIGALAALGRKEALALNIRLALNNGLTREELVEALLQLAPYAGFPACWDAFIVARDTLAQVDTDRRAKNG